MRTFFLCCIENICCANVGSHEEDTSNEDPGHRMSMIHRNVYISIPFLSSDINAITKYLRHLNSWQENVERDETVSF